jgi:GNAT superfamily N-acetyltransferase
MSITYRWRDDFDNDEVNSLHAEAFNAGEAEGRDWRAALTDYALGWVTARDEGHLVGFVNIVWDGLVHAWIQDTMVAANHRTRGIGTRLIESARDQAAQAGCEWLHVDFEDDLGDFYIGACGFTPTSAGLIHL